MRQQLSWLLLLVTLALTSSNLILQDDSLSFTTQPDDNTNSINTRLILNTLLCKANTETVTIPKLCRILAEYNEQKMNLDKGIGLDADGFRNKQWHNYPRQLDRLQTYFHERHKPSYHDMFGDKDNNRELIPNNVKNTDENANDNPFYILKVEPRPMNNAELDSNNYLGAIPESQPGAIYQLDQESRKDGASDQMDNDLNTALYAIKMKRSSQPETSNNLEFGNSEDIKPSAQKRIFSLWSRLQSLSHKGHELHHRRHLHAFYGLSEDQINALSADGRPVLLRPPGSPLRWG